MKLVRGRSKKRKPVRTTDPRKMLYQQLVVGVILVVVLTALIAGIWYGTRVENWQIATVEVVGGKTISHELVEEIAREELAGTNYRLVPKTFTVTYPEEAIMKEVAAIPRVKEVRLEKADAATLTVAFTEYEPFALWCEEGDGRCMFLDHTGYAFAPSPQLSGNALMRYYLPETAVNEKVSPFSRSVFATTKEFATLLQDELDLYITDIIVSDEIDISYVLTSGAELKVSNRLSAEESVANLETIFSNEEFKHLSQGDFHYIDLRFGDKVFVSETELVASSTATSSAEVVEPGEGQT